MMLPEIGEMDLITSHLCLASDIGVHSNMFGGRMMELIDMAAGIYSSQICRTPNMVTVMVDKLIFKTPVKLGNTIKFYGRVSEFGTTSVTLYLEVRKQNVYKAEETVVVHTEIKFVRIDEEGNSLPIPTRVKERYYEERKLQAGGKV